MAGNKLRSHHLLFISISRGRKTERRTLPFSLLQKLGEGEALFKANAKLRLNKIALITACPFIITRTYSVKKQDIKLRINYATMCALCCFTKKGVIESHMLACAQIFAATASGENWGIGRKSEKWSGVKVRG